ncbi:MAG: RnfABCDGE type electron transport complex subunit G [Clostridia bacterium]
MKFNAKNIVLPAIILCLICFCVSGLLVLTNELTKDQIALALEETAAESRMIVMSDADSFEEIDANTYLAKNGDTEIGYVFTTETSGYSGTVSVMTGIDMEKNITGIVILSQSETPGLGANCVNESFTDKFKQQVSDSLSVVKNTASGDGNIEAMTGATITSTAVTDAVNIAIGLFDDVSGGEG